MIIKNQSLYGANIVFLFKEKTLIPTDAEFASLFTGDRARGINFLDNPVMGAKLMNIPALGLSVIWEGERLRIEDRQAREPEDSPLVFEALRIFKQLLGERANRLIGFGFNFDVYYQTKDPIRIQDRFTELNPSGLPFGDSLLDLGWQWTLSHKSGKQLEGYFVKITAPLELAVHHNSHFKETVLPEEKDFTGMFTGSLRETHGTISNLAI